MFWRSCLFFGYSDVQARNVLSRIQPFILHFVPLITSSPVLYEHKTIDKFLNYKESTAEAVYLW